MEKSYSEQVIDNLRKILSIKGLSQKSLVEAMDRDESSVSKVFNGKAKLSLDQLANIASFLGMPVIDIITYPEKYERALGPADEPTEVFVQLKLKKEKKDQVLKLVFGENDIEILNR